MESNGANRPEASGIILVGQSCRKLHSRLFLDAGLGVSPRDLLEEMEEMAERGTAEYLIIGQRQVGSGRWVLVKRL